MNTALRAQRKRAIDACDFRKAKIIDLQLKRLCAERDETAASQQTLQSQVDYSKVKDLVHSEADKEYSKAIEAIYQIESEFQGRLAILISDHAEELSAHATSLAAELELSSIRPVPDSLVMTHEAKTTAKIGEFDRAQSLYETSNEVHYQTVTDRHTEVREVYERLQKQLDSRQKDDLKRNADKKLARVREVVRKYQKAVDRLKKQLANAAFRYQVAQDEEEEAAFFSKINPEGTMQLPDQAVRPLSRSNSASPKGSPGSASPPGHSSTGSPPKVPSTRSPPRPFTGRLTGTDRAGVGAATAPN
jgi:tetratricopeptide (TPR) repeat protein